MKNTKLIKKFMPYYKKYWGIMIFDLFCATLTILCEVLFPIIVKYITDTAMTDIGKLTLNVILLVGGIYLVLRIIDAAANYFMQYIGHVMGSRIETDMRTDMFAHLQKLSFTYYSNTKIGTIMSRITNDLFEVTEFAHHCPEEFYIAFVKITVSFAILCTYNLYLTLILFALIPIMILCASYFNKQMRKAFRKQRKQLGEINANVEDSLLGIRVVKSFAGEDIEQKKFEESNGKFLKIKREMYKAMAKFHSVIRIFDGLMYITVVVAGSLFLSYGKISIGEFTAYLLFVSTLLQSVRRIVEFTEQFGRGMTGIERFFEIMEEPIDIKDTENAIEMYEPQGAIKFNNVTFHYNENDIDVLKDINIDIKKGENIAIVGASGGGKTTFCNLIPRFYDIAKGEILIDDINVKQFTLKSLRKNIGIVQQDIYLFSGTIYENIEYGKPGASYDEVIQSAKDSGAHDFIMSFPDGYNTYVGERGVKLSGGQKQRISIARVFLKNPPILILDEATSALDNESERLIQNSLVNLSKGRTTITIAHRLTTIKNADRIIVLTKDGIKEEGTHNELMDRKGIYYDMNNI